MESRGLPRALVHVLDLSDEERESFFDVDEGGDDARERIRPPEIAMRIVPAHAGEGDGQGLRERLRTLPRRGDLGSW